MEKIVKGKSLASVDGMNAMRRPEKTRRSFRTNALVVFKPYQAFLRFRPETDKTYPRRPYLMIQGHCAGVQADEQAMQVLPGGIDEIVLDPSDYIPMRVRYEFTDRQIADMVMKGLFTAGFQCPEEIRSAQAELLGFSFPISILISAPGIHQKNPVFFVDLPKKDLVVTAESSYYDFGQLFEKAPHADPEHFAQDPQKSEVEKIVETVEKHQEPEEGIKDSTEQVQAVEEPVSLQPEETQPDHPAAPKVTVPSASVDEQTKQLIPVLEDLPAMEEAVSSEDIFKEVMNTVNKNAYPASASSREDENEAPSRMPSGYFSDDEDEEKVSEEEETFEVPF